MILFVALNLFKGGIKLVPQLFVLDFVLEQLVYFRSGQPGLSLG